MTLLHEQAWSEAPRAGSPVLVLLHGRGSDMHDLLGLRSGLPAEVPLVTPQAPFPGQPWGYGPGWAWYRYVSDDRVVPETLERSLDAVDTFLDALPEILGSEPGPILLGGFSQGGTTSLAYALTRPGRITLVANFSGFLVSDPPVARGPEDSPTPVFWGHGLLDPAIPHALAVRGRERLVEMGVAITERDYRIGHGIVAEELADFSAWMSAAL